MKSKRLPTYCNNKHNKIYDFAWIKTILKQSNFLLIQSFDALLFYQVNGWSHNTSWEELMIDIFSAFNIDLQVKLSWSQYTIHNTHLLSTRGKIIHHAYVLKSQSICSFSD